jgi:hypothetical protein
VGKRIDKYSVQLQDGTIWALDTDAFAPGDSHDGIEYLLRYGTPEAIVAARMTIAGIVGSYSALLSKTQKRRNEVVKEILATLYQKGEVQP